MRKFLIPLAFVAILGAAGAAQAQHQPVQRARSFGSGLAQGVGFGLGQRLAFGGYGGVGRLGVGFGGYGGYGFRQPFIQQAFGGYGVRQQVFGGYGFQQQAFVQSCAQPFVQSYVQPFVQSYGLVQPVQAFTNVQAVVNPCALGVQAIGGCGYGAQAVFGGAAYGCQQPFIQQQVIRQRLLRGY